MPPAGLRKVITLLAKLNICIYASFKTHQMTNVSKEMLGLARSSHSMFTIKIATTKR
jgi:hypothetical protein